MVAIPKSAFAVSQATNSGDDVTEKEQAARTIQRIYRGYRTRREFNGLGISAGTRWTEALKDVRWTQLRDSTKTDDVSNLSEEANDPAKARKQWHRAVSVAMQAGSNNDSDNNSDKSAQDHNHDDLSVPRHDIEPTQNSKQMGLKYFLEMVDLKHRHGSNLRAYHEEWKKCPTTQNFFYWLDYGDGRDVNLEKRPRERLERAQVRYLSREERAKYLVSVDQAGQLRWAKNGELITTDGNRFRDSLEGVVPVDDPAPCFRGNERVETSSDSSSLSSLSVSSSEGEIQDETGSKDTAGKQGIKKIGSKLAHPGAILNHLVGKPPKKKKEEWIFVADTSFRLYIGIKNAGTFQHSSFLRGGRISAAGTIKVRKGQLRSLKPLSGHYQPEAANFHAFNQALLDQGVDMSRVSMSKSYAMLAGIAGYSRTKGKVRSLQDTLQKQGQGEEAEGRERPGS